jgi:mRNA interferase MazF
MTTYRPGDLVLIAFPFSGGGQVKSRPAMVVLDVGDPDILAARVTTQPAPSCYDVRLQSWQSAGLLAPSTVRLHKLAALEKSLVQRRLGRVQPDDFAAVSAALRSIADAWESESK